MNINLDCRTCFPCYLIFLVSSSACKRIPDINYSHFPTIFTSFARQNKGIKILTKNIWLVDPSLSINQYSSINDLNKSAMKYEQSQQDVDTFPQGSGLSAVFCCFIITELDVLSLRAIGKALLDCGIRFSFLLMSALSIFNYLGFDSLQEPTSFKSPHLDCQFVNCYHMTKMIKKIFFSCVNLGHE